jgi:hypothetical protein
LRRTQAVRGFVGEHEQTVVRHGLDGLGQAVGQGGAYDYVLLTHFRSLFLRALPRRSPRRESEGLSDPTYLFYIYSCDAANVNKKSDSQQ